MPNYLFTLDFWYIQTHKWSLPYIPLLIQFSLSSLQVGVMRSTSKKWQNNSKNPTTQRLTSSGTSILTPSRDSRPSITTLPETTDKGSTNDIHFGDQPTSMIIGEMTRGTTMAEMELLAQNRGNAMLRYKEKRKTRRHVLSSYLLYYNF